MSPAETLRKAAKLMRERAGAATPGPWHAHSSGDVCDDWFVTSRDYGLVSTGINDGPDDSLVLVERDQRDAAHIASWHPGAALAVADWLESLSGIEWIEREPPPFVELTHALNVARAYLGEAS